MAGEITLNKIDWICPRDYKVKILKTELIVVFFVQDSVKLFLK